MTIDQRACAWGRARCAQAALDSQARSATVGRMQEAVEVERANLSEAVQQHTVEVAALQRLGQEDSGVKHTVQSIIYDIEREAQLEVGRWKVRARHGAGVCAVVAR